MPQFSVCSGAMQLKYWITHFEHLIGLIPKKIKNRHFTIVIFKSISYLLSARFNRIILTVIKTGERIDMKKIGIIGIFLILYYPTFAQNTPSNTDYLRIQWENPIGSAPITHYEVYRFQTEDSNSTSYRHCCCHRFPRDRRCWAHSANSGKRCSGR